MNKPNRYAQIICFADIDNANEYSDWMAAPFDIEKGQKLTLCIDKDNRGRRYMKLVVDPPYRGRDIFSDE